MGVMVEAMYCAHARLRRAVDSAISESLGPAALIPPDPPHPMLMNVALVLKEETPLSMLKIFRQKTERQPDIPLLAAPSAFFGIPIQGPILAAGSGSGEAGS